MDKDTGKGYQVGTNTDRLQLKDPKTGLWTKREGSTGHFSSHKKTGGDFKGIRKEK